MSRGLAGQGEIQAGLEGIILFRVPELYGFLQASIFWRKSKPRFFETHHSFINQANNTHGLGAGHNRGKARTNPRRYPRAGQKLQKRRPGPAVLIHTCKTQID
jgi:hypothetical protein